MEKHGIITKRCKITKTSYNHEDLCEKTRESSISKSNVASIFDRNFNALNGSESENGGRFAGECEWKIEIDHRIFHSIYFFVFLLVINIAQKLQ
jgi:hypothetical protein